MIQDATKKALLALPPEARADLGLELERILDQSREALDSHRVNEGAEDVEDRLNEVCRSLSYLVVALGDT